MFKVNALGEECTVAVMFVHVEAVTLHGARGVPREVHRIDIVAQATLVLVLTNVPAHMVPVCAKVLAVIDGHAFLEVREVFAVGEHSTVAPSVPFMLTVRACDYARIALSMDFHWMLIDF